VHKSRVPGHCGEYILYDGPNICESSWWNFQAPRWLILFWKSHAPLFVTQFKVLFQGLTGRTGETIGKPQLGCLLLSCNFVWLYNRIATLPTVTFILFYLYSITTVWDYCTSQFSSLMALSILIKKYMFSLV
jgi:hypothetical protein